MQTPGLYHSSFQIQKTRPGIALTLTLWYRRIVGGETQLRPPQPGRRGCVDGEQVHRGSRGDFHEGMEGVND